LSLAVIARCFAGTATRRAKAAAAAAAEARAAAVVNGIEAARKSICRDSCKQKKSGPCFTLSTSSDTPQQRLTGLKMPLTFFGR
jgi:hypothetical protein